MKDYVRETPMPGSAQELFDWHERPGAFQRLTPPWESITLLRSSAGLCSGSEVHFTIRKGGKRFLWVAKHTECHPPHEFVDVQLKGPFEEWVHRHQMIPIDSSHSKLRDQLTFSTPFSIGEMCALRMVRRMFAYRHRLLQCDLRVQRRFPSIPLKVAIAGASGMVGSALHAFLQTGGHQVLPLVRRSPKEGEIYWDPIRGVIDQKRLEGIDAVVNLAGENIGSGLWTKGKKKRISESRILGTRLLAETLNQLNSPPKVFISPSAVGYYGAHVSEPCTEESRCGSGFLSSLCSCWEKESQHFTRGRRVVPRIGVVLSSSGGIVKKLTPLFQIGLGARWGTGNEMMSWIALDDLIYMLYQCIVDEQFVGPINLCAPCPITVSTFAKTLGRVLQRPASLSISSWVVQRLFGAMGKETLLASCVAIPKVLEERGGEFYYPKLEEALRHTLGRGLDVESQR